jgi:ribosome-binding protein aMBF1 (putative translation factor)
MIKNEREYKITRASVRRFEEALVQLEELREHSTVDPRKITLQEAATTSILLGLQGQLQEYDALKQGGFQLSVLDTVESLPLNLIRARIALGWTQKDLSRRLRTTEQQIQKYEASDYESASLKRIAEIVSVLREQQRRA